MRLLFLGDVVGRYARKQVMASAQALRQNLNLDFIIVNVENAAGGFGITPDIADAFLASGVDVLTTGNHVWDRREIIPYIASQNRLLRPYNMIEHTPGAGVVVVTNARGQRLAVAQLMGNLFMPDNPSVFTALEELLKKYRLCRDADAFILDIHGEASSEKTALGLAADGRLSLVAGTHTHIPTADYRILPQGTAYITDVGMCGCYDSVIGMATEPALGRFLGQDARLEVAKGEPTLCGVVVETDGVTGLATSITPYRQGGVLG